MDRRGENLIRPLMLAIGFHIILLSTFFIAVSPEAKTITPPPVVVIKATALTFAPSAAAEDELQLTAPRYELPQRSNYQRKK